MMLEGANQSQDSSDDLFSSMTCQWSQKKTIFVLQTCWSSPLLAMFLKIISDVFKHVHVYPALPHLLLLCIHSIYCTHIQICRSPSVDRFNNRTAFELVLKSHIFYHNSLWLICFSLTTQTKLHQIVLSSWPRPSLSSGLTPHSAGRGRKWDVMERLQALGWVLAQCFFFSCIPHFSWFVLSWLDGLLPPAGYIMK